jgi:tetratricopeptide (TPR) repeat protein
METLRWIGRFITAVAVGLTGTWLSSNFDFLAVFYWAYPTEILLGTFVLILLIAGLCFLEIILHRRRKLKEALKEVFEISKPVKKLTPDDFGITNYNEFYIERESDKETEKLLKERKYVFITGIPMLGKTRMAYESAKKLRGFYLLKPKYGEIDIQKLKLPLFKKKIVLFLDDLDKYVGKFNLDDLVRKLKEKTKDFVVIATCRSGKEFDQVFAKKEMETLLTQCKEGKTEPRKLEQEEERELAETVGKSLEDIRSDGTPGSITIDLRYMKDRYDELGEEKYILKCLKLLREGNIFLWKENLVKEVSNRIFGLKIERISWDGYVESLSHNGFIKMSSEQFSISHDVYLDDKFLDDYFVKDDDLKSLKGALYNNLKDAENLLSLGNSFYYKKNMSEAEDCYQKSIKINPDYAGGHNNLGNFLTRLKRYEEAEKEYKEALRLNPDFAQAHYNLGNLLKEVKRYPEAEKEYKEALRINPDSAEAHYNLGNLFKELKRYPEAEKEYKEALRINPDYAGAHNNLGNLLSDLERYEEAEKEYRAALRINPDFAGAHCNLGNLFKELKRYKEAEKEYKEALRINPDFAGAHNNLGVLLYELKRYEEAEKEYKEALRINPDYAETHGNFGILLMDLNRKDEAKKEFEIACDLFRKQGREEDAKKAEEFLKDL